MARKQRKLTYRVHDPNPPEVLAAHLERLFIEVHKPKVERILREAARSPSTDERKPGPTVRTGITP